MADINTSVLTINGNNLILQDAAVRGSLANAYSASSTYAVGDMVLKDGQLYECNTAITTAEAWTAAHWTAVTVGGELSTVKDGLTDLKEDFESLQTDLEQTTAEALSAYVTDTASGSIASFPDGAAMPVKSLTVAVEPVQDLHGQANPYPAGGGKNLIPLTESAIKSISGKTWTGDSVVENGVTFTIQKDNGGNVIGISANGTPSSSVAQITIARVDITEGVYTFSGITGGGANSFYVRYVVRDSNGQAISIEGSVFVDIYTVETTKTLPSNASYVNAYLGVAVAVSNKVFTPMIRPSSVSDATFAPYSNICPISGHTSAVVTRTGKNLLDKDSTDKIGAYIDAEGVIHTSNQWTTTGLIRVEPSKKYVLSGLTAHPNTGVDNYRIFNSSGSYLGVINKTATQYPIEFTSNVEFIQFCYKNTDKDTVMLEVGSTASTFEPYTAQTYTIDLDGTRYGGTLDVGTGVLTVDRQYIDCTTITTWTLDKSAERFYKIISELLPATAGGDVADGLICNRFKSIPAYQIYAKTEGVAVSTGSALQFHITGLTDDPNVTLAQINEYFTNNETIVVAKLATPTTVQLTANEVETLLGQNNIWADCGNVTAEYRADTKLYIEKLTAPTEDDMIADHAISANTFFMVGNTLYRATTAIASGATITVGTNATRLSLADALNTLS